MLKPVVAEPLYTKVKKQLIEYIEERKPAVLPKEKDLMSSFEVSRNTLRRAVLELTNDGVLKPIQGRGTMVVKYAGLEPMDIGVVMDDSFKLTSPYIASKLDAMRSILLPKGYNLNVFFCHDFSINPSTNSVFSYLVQSKRLAGIILISRLSSEEIEYFNRNNIKFITSEFYYKNYTNLYVMLDYNVVIEKAFQAFEKRGIRNIAFCGHQLDYDIDATGVVESGMKRYMDYVRSLSTSEYIIDMVADVEKQLDSLYKLGTAKRPEGFICMNYHNRVKLFDNLKKYSDWKPFIYIVKVKDFKSELETEGYNLKGAEIGKEASKLIIDYAKGKAQVTDKRLILPGFYSN
ncbi:MAG: GntR family transcriptional regulator [Lentisphaerae bacterium]|nr:GntR family transcriptional regulator [Lentisphaerota bacterium]MCP4103503.1 GntR family transcriptional regulator [Lentisphaerota bacterium]